MVFLLNVSDILLNIDRNNNNLDIDKLFVKEAFVGKSLRMKRFRPMSKGRAFQIIKPFSRLTLVLEERV